MMARSCNGSTDEAEDTTAVRLVVQDLGSPRIATALRARQGPAAAFGGALRAALTRAHAAAWAQLGQRRETLRWPVNERTFYSTFLFS